MAASTFWACRSQKTSDVIARGRRISAFGVDTALALLVTGLVISPILALADPSVWERTNPIPLIWALSMILLSLIAQGQTPGKRWMRLTLSGPGCLICRELRRMIWALVFGFQQLLLSTFTPNISYALQTLAVGLFLWLIIRPMLTQAPEFSHNLSTGIQVVDIS